MKYHQFAPDPDAIAARIEGPAFADAPADRRTAPGQMPPPGDRARPDGAVRRSAPETLATLAGITGLRDRAFLTAAYRLLLGRDPDPASDQFLNSLRNGALDKVDVLGELRYSAEGRQRAVDIPGLGWRYATRRIGRIRGIGWMVRWLEGAVRLPSLLRDARRQQAAIELASVEADAHVAAIGRIQGELRGLMVRLATAEGMLEQVFGDSGVLSRADRVETDLRAYRDEVRATEQRLAARYKRLAEVVERLASASGEPEDASRLAPVPPPQHVSPEVQAASAAHVDATIAAQDFENFYLEFEDRFRGSREETKRLQEVYLDYVRSAGAGTSDAPIVDVGCGRGEWLELLRERGFVGRGVDGNRVMIAGNVERGLDVVAGDALAHLAALPDASVGMVTGFHIIEHLPFAQLVRLFDECRRVLRPGGCAVFETPNPENLVVSGYTFYFDPTHRHPLPPQMTEFLAWQRGFSDVQILRLHPRPEVGSDRALLDRWFRTATDYAVIAWKDRKGLL